MPGEFEYHGIGNIENTGFQAFLAAAITKLRTTPFVNIDSNELALYSALLQYRVQRDLFELLEEAQPGSITWDDFVSLMHSTQTLRDICMDVICKKMNTSSFVFDFNKDHIDLSLERIMNSEDFIHAVRLFSDDEGVFLMALYLFLLNWRTLISYRIPCAQITNGRIIFMI